jgi:hypothetical protein
MAATRAEMAEMAAAGLMPEASGPTSPFLTAAFRAATRTM